MKNVSKDENEFKKIPYESEMESAAFSLRHFISREPALFGERDIVNKFSGGNIATCN